MIDIKQLTELFPKAKVFSNFALPLLVHCDRLAAGYRHGVDNNNNNNNT
jgi:hypothetical protein